LLSFEEVMDVGGVGRVSVSAAAAAVVAKFPLEAVEVESS